MPDSVPERKPPETFRNVHCESLKVRVPYLSLDDVFLRVQGWHEQGKERSDLDVDVHLNLQQLIDLRNQINASLDAEVVNLGLMLREKNACQLYNEVRESQGEK